MARSRSRFLVRRGQKRATFWGRSPADGVVQPLAAATAILDSTAIPLVQGETIIRARGSIWIASDQAVDDEFYVGAVGMCIATDQAVAVGVGSIPTPYTDQDSELWFMHQYFAGGVEFSSAIGMSPNWFTRFEFDSKAMRKMPSGNTLCIVVENGSTAAGITYFLNYAVLFKVA